MNREILYRGKRLDNGKWVYGSPIEYFGATYIMELPDFTEDRVYGYAPHKELWSHEVDPDTVGQCTGRTDKNGVKVFKGDGGVHHSIEMSIRCTVVWHKGAWMLVDEEGNYALLADCAEEFEVTSNIHDKEGE